MNIITQSLTRKRHLPILGIFAAGLMTSGCVSTAISAAGATAGAAIKVTGATVATGAKVGGAVVGGTVDAIIPGDQSGKKDKDDHEDE